MAMQNVFNILVDLKVAKSIPQPLVTQNDSVVFILEVMQDGVPFDLTDTTIVSLAHTRKDQTVVVTPGTKLGNKATFELGTNETSVTGAVTAKAQFYDSEGRVSTLSFSYQVGLDPTGADYVPSETEQTLIQVVMADAQAKIDELSAVDVVDLSQQLAEADEQLNSRIDGIIATPTMVSEQEIMDARQGELSLGANITSVKDQIVELTEKELQDIHTIRELPNGVKDEFDFANDSKIQQVSVNYILQASDISLLPNTYINVDVVRILMPVDGIPLTKSENSGAIQTGFSEPAFALFADNASLIGKHCYGTGSFASNTILYVVAKGRYVDNTSAKADMAGKSMIYQLASPQVISFPSTLSPNTKEVLRLGELLADFDGAFTEEEQSWEVV